MVGCVFLIIIVLVMCAWFAYGHENKCAGPASNFILHILLIYYST